MAGNPTMYVRAKSGAPGGIELPTRGLEERSTSMRNRILRLSGLQVAA